MCLLSRLGLILLIRQTSMCARCTVRHYTSLCYAIHVLPIKTMGSKTAPRWKKGWNKKLFTCRSGSTSCASTYVYVNSNVLKLLFQRCLSFLVFMTCLMFDILFVHSEDHPQSQSKDDLKKVPDIARHVVFTC